MLIVYIFLLFLFLFFLIKVLDRKPPHLPPGKWGVPGFGYFPLGTLPLSGESVAEMKKKFGDIFSWKVGSRTFIIICNPLWIKEAFSNSKLSGRPDFMTYLSSRDFKPYGVITSEKEIWKETRKFTLRILQNIGWGKSSMEQIIQFEADAFVQSLKMSSSQHQTLSFSLNVALHNVIWKLVADKRYDDIEDKKLLYFEDLVRCIFEDCQVPMIMIFDLMPWLLSVVPKFVQKWLGVFDIYKKTTQIKDFIKEVIEEHKESLNTSEPRDLIDKFLIKIEEEKKPFSAICYDALVQVVQDLFIAGSETTSSSLRWAVSFLTKYRSTQERLQAEIDQVIGKERLPSLAERNRMPYTEAVIHETLRLSSFTPLTVPHRALEDTPFAGYTLPKDSVVVGFAEGVHKDPGRWKRPNDFYPEHFLDEDGNFVLPSSDFLPFSVGNRMCIGDNLAKMEMFIFLTTIFQKLSFFPACKDDFDIKKDDRVIYFNVPKLLQFVIKERHVI